MKITLVYIIFILTISSCCLVCEDDKCVKTYSLEADFDLSPSMDSFTINDTFRITCNLNTKFISENNDVVDLKDIGLKIDLYFIRIDTFPSIQNFEDFELFVENGSAIYFEKVGVSGYKLVEEINIDAFKLNLAIVPKTIGLYNLTMSSMFNLPNKFGPELDTGDECDEYIDNFAILLNGNDDNNYNFLKKASSEDWQNLPNEDFINGGGFCFYVK